MDLEFTRMFKSAHNALLRISKGSSERDAVAQSWAKNREPVGLRKETLALVLGTVSQQDLLDLLIGKAFAGRKFRTDTQCLLRLIVQIVTHPIEEMRLKRLEHDLRNIVAVELVPMVELLIGTLGGFDETSILDGLSDVDQTSIKTHHPAWWVEYCFRLFGRDEAIDLLSGTARGRYVHVNSLRNRGRTTLPKSTEGWTSILEKIPSEPNVYSLKAPSSNLSKYFREGLFQFQDLASYIAVKAADPKPRETVLDLCAAPGAKTSAAAQLMRNHGRIVSVDYSLSRMNSWKRETKRLGVTNAEPIVADATKVSLNQEFDLAIVDPPCTGTGVLDRNPRMKWRLSEKSLRRLATLQLQLLESASTLVGPKGRIMYCTCSVTEEENELVISGFLKNHPEFETTPSVTGLGSTGLRGFSDCRRFYPHRDGTAGFFIARMDRVS